ncbi:MAG TPA: glycosyltransferase family 9 protein [Flavisolibacter sp.]|jgi:ADP-heptose:LPS heptosyltransferase|nr:glycosyltransferase family 9 protein [Flavisolibacter sp.]
MKILVRLPNWLGDMVMATGFMNQLSHFFPGAEISVIAKKGIDGLLPFFPAHRHAFIFSKEEYKGFSGLYRFGRSIRATESFDLFFCLPDSISSAFMGFASGARKRIGYKKELREVFLTHTYSKPKGQHRVMEYISQLERFTGKEAGPVTVRLQHTFPKKDHIIININSEASSRRLTVPKAVELISSLRKTTTRELVLIGAPKEREFVEGVIQLLPEQHHITSLAGKTSLPQLMEAIASAQLMLTTDSGPAHLGNALGTHTVVLFGAGNENNTAPFHKEDRSVIRLGKLSCEPCQKNTCIQFQTPQCLELLEPEAIIQQVLSNLQ